MSGVLDGSIDYWRLRALRAEAELRARPQAQVSLTAQQRALLTWIKGYMERHGTAPSVREMKEAMGFASTENVSRLLKALQERGHIIRLKGRARAMQLVGDA
jgi:SOS-response transcriptional repressor LexA